MKKIKIPIKGMVDSKTKEVKFNKNKDIELLLDANKKDWEIDDGQEDKEDDLEDLEEEGDVIDYEENKKKEENENYDN